MRFAVLHNERNELVAVNPRAIKFIHLSEEDDNEGCSVSIEFLGEDDCVLIKEQFDIVLGKINEALDRVGADVASDQRRSKSATA